MTRAQSSADLLLLLLLMLISYDSWRVCSVIQKLGFDAKFTDFKVQNIVGSCDVRFPIRLERLCMAHGTFCSYEPELFPGLIYRMLDPKVVLLIFVSGKIVLTGAKYQRDINKAFELIYATLGQFRNEQNDKDA